MPILPRLRPSVGHEAGADGSKAVPVARDAEIQAAPADGRADDVNGKPVVPDGDAQRGVQKIEAVTLAWNKKQLAGLLINILLIFMIQWIQDLRPCPFDALVALALERYRNRVERHGVGCLYPHDQLLDVWGRAEGFPLMVGFSTLGVILMATAKNLATLCAVQVFYSVGFAGIIYTVGVLAADVTSLRNRGLAFAFTSSPYMITAFAGF